jgi:hypothetical protein
MGESLASGKRRAGKGSEQREPSAKPNLFITCVIRTTFVAKPTHNSALEQRGISPGRALAARRREFEIASFWLNQDPKALCKAQKLEVSEQFPVPLAGTAKDESLFSC